MKHNAPESIAVDDLPTSPAIGRILAALSRHPGGLSRAEIAKAAYVSESTLSGGGYLKRLRAEGRIHISGWRRSASGAFTIPLFSLGPGPDYPRPAVIPANRAAAGMERIVEALMRHGPMDYRQLAVAAGLSPNTLKNAGYLDALLAQKRIYVHGWHRGRGGPPRALFFAGNGPNAPKPAPLTNKEKLRAYRQRKHAAHLVGNLAAQLRLSFRR